VTNALPDAASIAQFIKDNTSLAGWSKADLEQLAREADPVQVAANRFVFDDSYQADDAYIVYSGQVRQFVVKKDGVPWWDRVLQPGELFTQQALFLGASHASSAQAQTDSVLLKISAALLSDLLTKHPELWKIFYTNTARRLQAVPLLRSLDDNEIERFSVTATEITCKPNQVICSYNDPDGSLYVINWGQVRILEQKETVLNSSGALASDTPSHQVLENQGFPQEGEIILTAGNYFVGGLVKIPGQLSVTAKAVTTTSLIRLDRTHLEQLEQHFGDVRDMLRNRRNIPARLQQALQAEPLFAGLDEKHWLALAGITGWEHIPSNLDVTRQGQVGSKLRVLSDGEALVRATDEKGRERPRHYLNVPAENEQDLHTIHDYYGINALLRGERHDATVRSMVGKSLFGRTLDGTDWLTLNRVDLAHLLGSHSALWQSTTLWHETSEKPQQQSRYAWQDPDEEIILFQRKHWIWLATRLFTVFAVVYAVLAVMYLLDRSSAARLFPALTYALLALFGLGLPTLWYVVDYLNDYYIITNRRVLRHERVVLLYENQITAPLERIQDVASRTGLIGRLLNFAHLDISTAGLGVISLPLVYNAERMETAIRDLQGSVRAGAAAEERENLRNKILSSLKMRLIPDIPERVLPANLVEAAPTNGLALRWQELTAPWRRFTGWISSRPERFYLALLSLLPAATRQRLLSHRQQKKPRKPTINSSDIVYRKHPWFLLKAIAIPLAMVLGTVALFVFTELNLAALRQAGSAVTITLVIVFLVGVGWLWFRYENWRNDIYILSKTHIADVNRLPLGIYERRRQAEWEKVQNANYERPNIWANLLNYGTVIVETASVEGKFEFLNVDNPRMVQQEIMNRISTTRALQAQRNREQQQASLSETLEIYNELIQDWSKRNQKVAEEQRPADWSAASPTDINAT